MHACKSTTHLLLSSCFENTYKQFGFLSLLPILLILFVLLFLLLLMTLLLRPTIKPITPLARRRRTPRRRSRRTLPRFTKAFSMSSSRLDLSSSPRSIRRKIFVRNRDTGGCAMTCGWWWNRHSGRYGEQEKHVREVGWSYTEQKSDVRKREGEKKCKLILSTSESPISYPPPPAYYSSSSSLRHRIWWWRQGLCRLQCGDGERVWIWGGVVGYSMRERKQHS